METSPWCLHEQISSASQQRKGDLLCLGYFLLGNVRSRLSDVHFDAAQPGGQRLYLFAYGRSLAGWKWDEIWDEMWDEMWVPKFDDRRYHGTTTKALMTARSPASAIAIIAELKCGDTKADLVPTSYQG